MKIIVIDGQGGGIGKSIISRIRQENINAEIIAVGTNAIATMNMQKSGPSAGATGESAIVYNSRKCTEQDVITGPMGIINAYALHGEISPEMVIAISSSEAKKILLPSHHCSMYVAGVADKPLSAYMDDLISILKSFGMDNV